MPTTPISTNSAPGVAPPLYPGMLQPYLLQQAMAGGTPLGAALPFYPNFLQQLARFQNQAQLSNLLQTKRASTPVPLSTGKDRLFFKVLIINISTDLPFFKHLDIRCSI